MIGLLILFGGAAIIAIIVVMVSSTKTILLPLAFSPISSVYYSSGSNAVIILGYSIPLSAEVEERQDNDSNPEPRLNIDGIWLEKNSSYIYTKTGISKKDFSEALDCLHRGDTVIITSSNLKNIEFTRIVDDITCSISVRTRMYHKTEQGLINYKSKYRYFYFLMFDFKFTKNGQECSCRTEGSDTIDIYKPDFPAVIDPN